MDARLRNKAASACFALLAALIAFACATHIAQHAYAADMQVQDDSPSAFAVAVVGQNGAYVLEPTLVPYGENDTI